MPKRGRPALFTAEEIAEIQQAEGTLQQLANRFRSSRATIGRIRSESYEYAPVDAEGRSRTHPRGDRKKPVRIDEDARQRIAYMAGTLKEVADVFGCSTIYVAKLRQKYRTVNRPTSLLPPEVMDDILASSLDDFAMAKKYNVHHTIIRFIRQGVPQELVEGRVD